MAAIAYCVNIKLFIKVPHGHVIPLFIGFCAWLTHFWYELYDFSPLSTWYHQEIEMATKSYISRKYQCVITSPTWSCNTSFYRFLCMINSFLTLNYDFSSLLHDISNRSKMASIAFCVNIMFLNKSPTWSFDTSCYKCVCLVSPFSLLLYCFNWFQLIVLNII